MPFVEKHSSKREKMREMLKQRKDHPTADMLYSDLRQLFPNISLGTVYRNLLTLEKGNEIMRISNGSGTDHYDGNAKPHYHLSCNRCGRIYDVDIMPDDKLTMQAEEATGAKILEQRTIFYGICKNCKKVLTIKI